MHTPNRQIIHQEQSYTTDVQEHLLENNLPGESGQILSTHCSNVDVRPRYDHDDTVNSQMRKIIREEHGYSTSMQRGLVRSSPPGDVGRPEEPISMDQTASSIMRPIGNNILASVPVHLPGDFNLRSGYCEVRGLEHGAHSLTEPSTVALMCDTCSNGAFHHRLGGPDAILDAERVFSYGSLGNTPASEVAYPPPLLYHASRQSTTVNQRTELPNQGSTSPYVALRNAAASCQQLRLHNGTPDHLLLPPTVHDFGTVVQWLQTSSADNTRRGWL